MSSLETHNVVIGDRRTSVRLEPETWAGLLDIANRESLTVHEVCTGIYMGHTASSFTAALRVFALVYYWKQVRDGVRPSLVGPPGPDAHLRRDPRFARSSFQTAGEDFDRRTIWSADALHRTPRRGMFLAYRQWLDRFRASGRLPTYEDMLDGPMGGELANGTLNLIDTTPEESGDFLLEYLSAASNILGRRAERKVRHPIGRIAFKLHACALAADMLEVKSTERPQLASISQRLGGANRAYVRLALPLAGADGRVNRIATVVRGLRTFPSVYNEDMIGLYVPTTASPAWADRAA